MIKSFIWVICLFGMISGCSTNRKLLKEHDYAAVIRNSIEKLNLDAKDHIAGNTLTQTYSQAIGYYQTEIDLILTSNDPFRWTKTLDVMRKTNELSEEILYNSAALRLICDPKIYRDEMAGVTSKATAELYDQGIYCLNQQSKVKAKEAYFYFVGAHKLNPRYKDIDSKIIKAKNEARYKVIIEPVTAYTQNNVYSLSTKTFYQSLMYLLQKEFPTDGFISFYSPDDADEIGIDNPDYTVLIEISELEIGSVQKKTGGLISPRLPRTINVDKDGSRVPIGIDYYTVTYIPEKITSQLLIKANTILNIYSLSENKAVYKERIPWHYSESLNYSYTSTDGPRGISINSDNQVFFDRFSLSLCDHVASITCNYLNTNINISAVP